MIRPSLYFLPFDHFVSEDRLLLTYKTLPLCTGCPTVSLPCTRNLTETLDSGGLKVTQWHRQEEKELSILTQRTTGTGVEMSDTPQVGSKRERPQVVGEGTVTEKVGENGRPIVKIIFYLLKSLIYLLDTGRRVWVGQRQKSKRWWIFIRRSPGWTVRKQCQRSSVRRPVDEEVYESDRGGGQSRGVRRGDTYSLPDRSGVGGRADTVDGGKGYIQRSKQNWVQGRRGVGAEQTRVVRTLKVPFLRRTFSPYSTVPLNLYVSFGTCGVWTFMFAQTAFKSNRDSKSTKPNVRKGNLQSQNLPSNFGSQRYRLTTAL